MGDNLKILILEDNKEDAALLINELNRQQLSFTTRIVHSRQAFEEALREYAPDLILSDYALPSFDGLSAYHIKQELLPDVPFIIVSGTIGEENAIELIKAGVTDYALKDKLFVLESKIARALKDAEEQKIKKAESEQLRLQHQRLLEIAFLQSHQVRRPVATILGLINLFKPNDPNNTLNSEIIVKLEVASKELDNVIKEIVEKTNAIKKL
jgi:DNA-binding NtrC family response regulator